MQRESIRRRAFLALSFPTLWANSRLAAQVVSPPTASAKGTLSTRVPQRFMDAATELDLFLLTDPKTSADLPARHLRFMSKRGHFLIHTSDRSGSPQVYKLDWKTGDSTQLTEATALDPSTPALSADERSIFYFDGPVLKQVLLNKLKQRDVVTAAAGWERAPGFSLSVDESVAVWVEKQNGRMRLRSVLTQRGAITKLAESAGVISDPQLRHGAHNQVLYRADGILRLVNADGTHDRAIPLDASGTPGEALWSPTGETVLYLSRPADPKQLVTLREYTVADNTDRLVAKTSQFSSFGANADTSVFAGASRGAASPYIVLLVRMARRELTLCEHRSSDAATVSPVFSPDSQSIFFTSDRTGKRAIYRIHVERFVEQTE